jgi:hypothetical protein
LSADVSVQYNGLCTSGKVDADVKMSEQFKSYSKEVNQSVSCEGGDSSLATSLSSGFREDNVFDTFSKWAHSTGKHPGIMSLQTATLWDAMTATWEPDIVKYAHDVEVAYNWIMENPQLHKTKCRFTINSDWGEFGITSPNAFVVQDPDHPPPSDNLSFSGTKITWGKEHSHEFQRDVTVEYVSLM